MNKLNLLEYLVSQSGCSYVSDLRMKDRPQRLFSIVEQTEVDDFPYKEWLDATRYITGSNQPLSTSEEARALLLQNLQKPLQ